MTYYRKITQKGGEAHSYVCDLSNREDVYAVSKKIQEEIGNVTFLINNAGIVSGNDILGTRDGKNFGIVKKGT